MDPLLEKMIKPFLEGESSSDMNEFPVNEKLLALALSSIPEYKFTEVPESSKSKPLTEEMDKEAYSYGKLLQKLKAEQAKTDDVEENWQDTSDIRNKHFWSNSKLNEDGLLARDQRRLTERENNFISLLLDTDSSANLEDESCDILEGNSDFTLPLEFFLKHKFNIDSDEESLSSYKSDIEDEENMDTDSEDEKEEEKKDEPVSEDEVEKRGEAAAVSVQPVNAEQKFKFRFADEGPNKKRVEPTKDVLIKDPYEGLLLPSSSKKTNKPLKDKTVEDTEEETDIDQYRALLCAKVLVKAKDLKVNYGDWSELKEKVNWKNKFLSTVDKKYQSLWDEVSKEKPKTLTEEPVMAREVNPPPRQIVSKKNLQELDDAFFSGFGGKSKKK